MGQRKPYFVITVLFCAAWAQLGAQTPAAGEKSLKLTTSLADVASVVPQDDARAVAARALPSRAAIAVDALPKMAQDAIRSRSMRVNDRNEIQVYILMSEVTDATADALLAAGATIEIRDAARKRVQARVPASRLQAVAGLPFVTFIRLPTYARHQIGLTTTEGDHVLNADAVRQQLSVDGTGVRVGVISDGLKGLFATGCTSCNGAANGPIATGDLPDALGVRNASGVLTSSSGGIRGRSFTSNSDLEGLPPPSPACGFAGAGAEGTAILEVVHDLAPGAQLSFANPETDLDFAQAVTYLASTNDIVLDDLGFFGDALDGTSGVSSATAAALNNPSFPIRGYFTSVGNSADEHYYGRYTDSGQTLNGFVVPGNAHLFQASTDGDAVTTDVLGIGPKPYNVIALPRGGEVVIFLSWDDPFGGSANDYDLYLVEQSTGRVVARSVDAQRGAQDPIEFIDYVNSGAAGYFDIVVQNVGNRAQPRFLNLYSFEPQCANDGPLLLSPLRHERHNFNTATRSVTAQSDAGGTPVSAVAVGAICSASASAAAVSLANESCLDLTNSTIEFFSSRGPTLDGRQKPDVSAVDGVTVSGAGSFPRKFFGTSAAVPHVGAIAALALQAAPCLLDASSGRREPADARAALRHLIVDAAVPLTPTGAPDNIFGSGRVDAAQTVQRTLPVFNGSRTITVDASSSAGATLTAAQLGFTDPNQCALTRLSWTGGCGTGPGDTITCPRGTNTISVAASNNGLSFSAPVDLQVIVR